MALDQKQIEQAGDFISDIRRMMDLVDETPFGELGKLFDSIADTATKAFDILSGQMAEREARRCKAIGVHNHVNGTCTTCEKSEAECDCLPF